MILGVNLSCNGSHLPSQYGSNPSVGSQPMLILLRRPLHEDDDDTFMTSQEKRNLEKMFSKINQENNIKKGNTTNDEYFNSVSPEIDANVFNETSEGPISYVNLKLSEIFNEIINEELFNEINKDIVYLQILRTPPRKQKKER